MEDNANKPINFYNYVSPVTSPTPEQVKRIKKQQSTVALVVKGCIALFVVLSLATAFVFYQASPLNTGNTQVTPTVKPTNSPVQAKDYANIAYNLSYIQRTTPAGVVAKSRPEIDLTLLIYKAAFAKKWDGNLTKDVNFTMSDLDSAQLNRVLAEYDNNQKLAKIPTEIQTLLYGDTAEASVNQTLKEARTEYLKFVLNYGFNEEYVKEVEAYVLPETSGRIIYPVSGGSAVKQLNGDFGRLSIYIDPQDIYETYLDLKATVFAKKHSNQQLVSEATKVVMYEEMGKVLMQAYINQHVSVDMKRLGQEDMWKSADTDLLQYNKDYYWAWPYNKDINDERFARGLMILVASKQFAMDEDQQSDFVQVLVAKDNRNMNQLFEIGRIVNEQYAANILANDWNKTSNYFTTQLVNSTSYTGNKAQKDNLNSSLQLLKKFPYYIGYFNPMEEKDINNYKN
jgi:hypothetical protein